MALSFNGVWFGRCQDACRNQARLQTEVGERYQLGKRLNSSDNEFVLVHPKAKYLRALLTSADKPNCEWSVIVRDGNYRAMQVLKPVDFSDDYRWTERIGGDLIYIDLYACTDGRQPAILVESYIEMPLNSRNPYYSFQNPDQPLNVELFDSAGKTRSSPISNGLRRLGDNVVFVMNSYARTSWVCSGVLLKTGILLTNWHCGGIDPLSVKDYWNGRIVRDMVADLSWDGDNISRELQGVKLLYGSEELDFALLKVHGSDGTGSVVTLPISRVDGKPGDKIYLIHHTEGLPKQISICRVDPTEVIPGVHLSDGDFEHSCDTEKGSSGSPVFDQAGLLIGLHHEGFALDEKCKILDRENKAIRMSEIARDVKEHDAALYSQVFE